MKVLVIDTNLALEHARRIGKDTTCYYTIICGNPYPTLEETIGGHGFEEIIKVDDWGDVISEVDVVVFADVGFGGMADFLRKEGKFVFGADKKSENLELDRVYMRRTFEKLGIPIAEGKVVKGIDNVCRYIEQAKKKCFVKVNRVRGAVETFGTDDPEEARFLLHQGGFQVICDEATFIVEEELDGIEIGIDSFFNGKDYGDLVMETIELKGSGNITKYRVYEDSLWYDILEKLKPYLQKNGYRGMICFEGFYNGDKIRIIDVSCRWPFICSYAYPKDIKNFTEIICNTAMGLDVRPKVNTLYSCQVGVYTDNIQKWRRIHFPKEYEPKLAFRRVIRKGDDIWFVPGDYVVAVGIGNGATFEQAIDEAKKIADSVETIECYSQGAVLKEKFKERIEKLKDLGYEF